MSKEELKKKAEEKCVCTDEAMRIMYRIGYIDGAEPREKRITELEAQIEKMKCLDEEIIKAMKKCLDYEWLPAHNGKAKYLYLQSVIDIVNEKFSEIKENERRRNER